MAVTSKIISLTEGRVVAKGEVASKQALIRQSADGYLDVASPYGIEITIKNNILIPSAGIDESNGDGYYILYPEDIQKSAAFIWNHLRARHDVQELGIIITDSHTTPMRRGIIGIGLGWCGFSALYSYIGKPDCFNVPLKVSITNLLDSFAVAAVVCMGEGNEQTPLAVIKDAPKAVFQNRPPTQEELQALQIPLEEDLYAPLLANSRWVFT